MRVLLFSILFAVASSQVAAAQTAEETALFLYRGIRQGGQEPALGDKCGLPVVTESNASLIGSKRQLQVSLDCQKVGIQEKYIVVERSKCVFQIETERRFDSGDALSSTYVIDFSKAYLDEKSKVAFQASDVCSEKIIKMQHFSKGKLTQDTPSVASFKNAKPDGTGGFCMSDVDNGAEPAKTIDLSGLTLGGSVDGSAMPTEKSPTPLAPVSAPLSHLEEKYPAEVSAAKRHMKTFCEGARRRAF